MSFSHRVTKLVSFDLLQNIAETFTNQINDPKFKEYDKNKWSIDFNDSNNPFYNDIIKKLSDDFKEKLNDTIEHLVREASTSDYEKLYLFCWDLINNKIDGYKCTTTQLKAFFNLISTIDSKLNPKYTEAEDYSQYFWFYNDYMGII